MTNLHPLIIHFPIAFLTLYGVLELVRFQKVLEKSYWFYVKAVLVIAGSIGALASAITGGMISGWIIGGPKIFALHQFFALITIILSVGVAKAYGWQWIRPLNKYSVFVLRPKIIVTLAVLILIVIFITGGLGGAMAKGTDFDPLMRPILNLLGID